MAEWAPNSDLSFFTMKDHFCIVIANVLKGLRKEGKKVITLAYNSVTSKNRQMSIKLAQK